MKKYVRLCNGLNDRGQLFPAGEELEHITDSQADWYTSLYYYNEEHLKRFSELGTVAGIVDVTTNKLFFDFDSKQDIELARKDTVTLITRLEQQGINKNAIQVYFSGNKGYAVQVDVDKDLRPDEMRRVCLEELGKDLPTIDSSVYNSNRIIRVPGTRHQESRLYRIPISLRDVQNRTSSEIMQSATSMDNVQEFSWETAKLPEKLIKAVPKLELAKRAMDEDVRIDFVNKVKGWSNCKWALLNGYFKDGVRNQALTAITATCRGLNYPKNQAYYTAKSAMKESVARFGGEEYPKQHLWKVVESVYSPTWRGGTYSCKDGKSPWLAAICETLGTHRCTDLEGSTVGVHQVFNLFENYAENYENNVLETGIVPLDRKAHFLVGTSNAILAPPGAGKSSVAFNILNHNSKKGIKSIFFSYDMFHSMVYARLIQKHTNLQQDEIFDIFKHDKKRSWKIKEMLEQEYSNVKFCFKSGQTADEIYETILDTEQKIGEKVKLAMVDYSELVITPNTSDPTQSSAIVAQRLRQIANDASICTLTLLQPSKAYSNPEEEIMSYKGAKGSSAVAQSVSLMLSLSRPGFSPRHPEEDKYLTVNALKNRHGTLFTVDLCWDGLTGLVREMTDAEEIQLREIRERKALEKEGETSSGW